MLSRIKSSSRLSMPPVAPCFTELTILLRRNTSSKYDDTQLPMKLLSSGHIQIQNNHRALLLQRHRGEDGGLRGSTFTENECRKRTIVTYKLKKELTSFMTQATPQFCHIPKSIFRVKWSLLSYPTAYAELKERSCDVHVTDGWYGVVM